jgi:hypothetical protein
MPTTIQCERLSNRSPHYGKIAAEILLGLTLTLSIAAGIAYAEIALGGSEQLNAMALVME